MRTPTKHRNVRQHLETAIRSGEFRPGDQLPSEIDLAEKYGVSYMTARKAVAELVTADLLERRASKGTFVRQTVKARLATTTLNLVVSAYEGSNTREFQLLGYHLATQRGWNCNIIRLTAEQQEQAVRVIRNGELTIVMADDIPEDSSLWLAMKAAKGRAISFHQDVSSGGIPTVLSSTTEDLKLAVARLRSAGHERIGLPIQMPSEDVSPHLVIWQRAALQSIEAVAPYVQLLRVHAPIFASPMRPCYDVVTRCLRDDPSITAFITKIDEMAMATLAACRDAGKPIPESISLISMGNWHSMEFTQPPVTCVDFNFEAQFAHANEILDLALNGKPIEPVLRIVKGSIVERGSVGQRRALNSQPS